MLLIPEYLVFTCLLEGGQKDALHWWGQHKKNIFKVQKLEGVPHSKAMALNLLSDYVLQQ